MKTENRRRIGDGYDFFFHFPRAGSLKTVEIPHIRQDIVKVSRQRWNPINFSYFFSRCRREDVTEAICVAAPVFSASYFTVKSRGVIKGRKIYILEGCRVKIRNPYRWFDIYISCPAAKQIAIPIWVCLILDVFCWFFVFYFRKMRISHLCFSYYVTEE